MCSKVKCLVACLVIGVFAIVVGIVAIIVGAVLGFKVLPDSVDRTIANNVKLQWSDQNKRWQKTPFPLTFKIYVFEVTNSYDVTHIAAKPVLKTKGPYVYRQYRKKMNVRYNENEEKFTYDQFSIFEFDKEYDKNLTEKDKITVLNVPKWVFLEQFDLSRGSHDWNDAFPDTKDTLFHSVSMREYLFEGYTFCKHAPSICTLIRKRAGNMKMMKTSDHLSFSFFGHINNKSDGEYTISSGFSDARKTGQIDTFNGLKYTKFWKGSDSICNEVRGTDFFVYSPFNGKCTVKEVFISDICRTVSLDYLERVKYMGIPGYRYVIRNNTLDSPTNNKENECFCIQQTKTLSGLNECHPDGFLDMGQCTNSPLLVSFPHFLWADPEYVKKVTYDKDGEEDDDVPDDEKYRTFVDLEPNTGIPMRGGKRLQFNMVMRPLNKFAETKNVQKVVFPVLWFEEDLQIPEYHMAKLKEKVLCKVMILYWLMWGLIVAGIIIILIGIIIYFCSCAKIRRKKTKCKHKKRVRRHKTADTRQTTDASSTNHNYCVPNVAKKQCKS